MEEILLQDIVPGDGSRGTWIGRIWVPQALAFKGVAGPHVVCCHHGVLYDLSERFDTTCSLLNDQHPAEVIRSNNSWREIIDLDSVVQNSIFYKRQADHPFLLAPNDVQAIKACGVTFIQSLLERVIEEKAQGDPKAAQAIRAVITEKIGTDLSRVNPGSEQAQQLKIELQRQGIWSQYLEVGIGKDAEVFTKSQPLSAVTFGAQIGVLQESNWNNPEPEVVLAVSNLGKIQGATLGNDVNLRDYEGRSALLLGEAKDQNGSCSIGPFIRLFDDTFSLDDVKTADIKLSIHGLDGFTSQGISPMRSISRQPEDLVDQVIGRNHQYPDGFMLFLGTMFAPTDDRLQEGEGFTHQIGDRVEIQADRLGKLINWVNHCHEIPRWTFGINEFIRFILERRN